MCLRRCWQTFWEGSHWEREGVWGAGEQELWAHVMEEEPLQRQGEAGKLGSAQLDHQGAPPAESLLGGLASRSLLHGKIGGVRRLGQWGTTELEGPW